MRFGVRIGKLHIKEKRLNLMILNTKNKKKHSIENYRY